MKHWIKKKKIFFFKQSPRGTHANMHLDDCHGGKVADNSDCMAPSCGWLKQVVIKSQYSKAFSVKSLSCLITKCWWCLCHTICLTEKRVCGRAGHDTAQGMSIFQPICFLNLLPRFLFSVCFLIWRRKAREKHGF